MATAHAFSGDVAGWFTARLMAEHPLMQAKRRRMRGFRPSEDKYGLHIAEPRVVRARISSDSEDTEMKPMIVVEIPAAWHAAIPRRTASSGRDFLGASSVQGTLVFSSGRRPMRLLGAAARTVPKELRGYSFDVDASARVPGHDKQRLERLCRYILRPPIANDRLRKLPDGRFELRLKKPWSDGTTHLVFDGVELLARLVSLIPPCGSIGPSCSCGCSTWMCSRARVASSGGCSVSRSSPAATQFAPS